MQDPTEVRAWCTAVLIPPLTQDPTEVRASCTAVLIPRLMQDPTEEAAAQTTRKTNCTLLLLPAQ